MIKLVNQIKAVFRGIFGIEKYIVTPKQNITGNNLNEVFLQLFLSLLSGTAIIHGLFNISYSSEIQFWSYIVSIFWAFFYILLIVPLAITALKKKDLRKLYRFDGKFDIAVKYESAEPAYERSEGSGFARNVSNYGFSLTTDNPLIPTNQILELRIHLPSEVHIDAFGELKTLQPFLVPGYKIKYMQGIEFKNIKQADSDKITRFLMNVAAPKQAETLVLSRKYRIRD